MSDSLKVLLVEDYEDQQKIFKSTVSRLNDDDSWKVKIEFEVASDFNEAMDKIDGSFDGLILDLKLKKDDADDDGGNQIVEKLKNNFIRVPVIFVTGYPDLVNDNPLIVSKHARGESAYQEDFELLIKIKNTGLTNIMGGRGEIEKTLAQVFNENLLPQLDKWKEYGESDSAKTEKALLRHTINHLFQLLDNDDDKYFPEEVYIHPPLNGGFNTGSIVSRKGDCQYFVILSPACDLVIRKDGVFKTDRILLVEIEKEKDFVDTAMDGIVNKKGKEKKLESICRNNHTEYYHWLPKTVFYDGGFLNFRNLITLSKEKFDEEFDSPKIQVSPFFVKDIVARFSTYYARQGQPEINLDNIKKDYIT